MVMWFSWSSTEKQFLLSSDPKIIVDNIMAELEFSYKKLLINKHQITT